MSTAPTVAPDVLLVHRDVAANPVARAIARHRLRLAVRNFATRIYMLQEGEDVCSDADAAARTVYIGHHLATTWPPCAAKPTAPTRG